MATIRRHPVPADSFAPNRPLNDLLQAQLEHFREIEKRLPRPVQPTLNPDMPPASHKDPHASNRYIATMTTLLRERAGDRAAKRSPILVMKAGAHSPQSAGLAIAASDPSPASPELAAKPTKAAAKNKNAGTNKLKRRKP